VKIAVETSKLPANIWDSWLFKKNGQDGDYYRDRNGKPDVDSLQSSIDEQQKLGLFKSSFPVKDDVDLSLNQEAAARVK
jgi:hypothetical protein